MGDGPTFLNWNFAATFESSLSPTAGTAMEENHNIANDTSRAH
jgi:hypothetical protein